MSTEDEMRRLGKSWGETARAGWVIALVGGLGAGKTQWVKGFVEGIGHAGVASSPTFGILHQYDGGRLPVYHYDFYRLGSGEELVATGWDEVLEENGVVIAEWGNLFEAWLPAGTRWLDFQANADGSRLVKERC